MNTKKILLSSAIVAGMLISGAGMTSVHAAAQTEIKYDGNAMVSTFQTGYLKNADSVAVLLPSGTITLEDSKLKSIVEEKFSDADATVSGKGTGAKVTLSSEAKFTVVLYGDVDNNSKVNLKDARKIAEAVYEINNTTLSNAEAKAANLDKPSDAKINLKDARKVAEMAYGILDYADIKGVVPADNIAVMDLDEIEAAVAKANANFAKFGEIKFDAETNKATVSLTAEAKKQTIISLYEDKDLRKFAKSFVNAENNQIANDIESIEIPVLLGKIDINTEDGVEGVIYAVKDAVKDLLAQKYLKRHPELNGDKTAAVEAIKTKSVSDAIDMAEGLELILNVKLKENGNSLFSNGKTAETFYLEIAE